jgi:peptidoglycan hydrolase-like protein with peptidoglycan-binding domain
MIISPYPDFKGAPEEEFKNNRLWNLCYDNLACPEGTYAVYAKFFPEIGASPEIVSSTISYHKPDVTITSLPEPVKINGGAVTTDKSLVTISFETDKAVTKMIVSPYSDFHFAKIETFTATKSWNLCFDNPGCPEGIYRIHVKFFTDDGAEFGPFFAGIEYHKAAATLTSAKSILSVVLKKNLTMGMRSDDVKIVQIILAKDKEIYPEGLVTGLYGALTRKAVQRFQDKYQLATSKSSDYGKVQGKTLAKFMELSKLDSTIIAIIFKRDLKSGMSGNDVRILQEFLKTMPAIYPEGTVTGYFGALTRKAVIEFQKKFKLTTSSKDKEYGIFGKTTRAKFNEVFGL